MRSNLQQVWLLQAIHLRISRRAVDGESLDQFGRPGKEPNSPSDAAQLPGKRKRGRPRKHSIPSQAHRPSFSPGYQAAKSPEMFTQQDTPQTLPMTHRGPIHSQCISTIKTSPQPLFDRQPSSAEGQTSPLNRRSALCDGCSPPAPSASEAQDPTCFSNDPVNRQQHGTTAADACCGQHDNLHAMPRRSQRPQVLTAAAGADPCKPDSTQGIHLHLSQQPHLCSLETKAKSTEVSRAAVATRDKQPNANAGSRNIDSDANGADIGGTSETLAGTALDLVKGILSCKPISSSIPAHQSIPKHEPAETTTCAASIPNSPGHAHLMNSVSHDSRIRQAQYVTEADPLGVKGAQPAAAAAAAAADSVLDALAKSYVDAQAHLMAHPESSPPTAATHPGTPAVLCTVAKTGAPNTAPHWSSQPAATRELSQPATTRELSQPAATRAAEIRHQLPDQVPSQVHRAAEATTSPMASPGQATTRSGRARKQMSDASPESSRMPSDSQPLPDVVTQAAGLGPRRSMRTGLTKSAGTASTPIDGAASVAPSVTPVADAPKTNDMVAAEKVKRPAASDRWSEHARKPKVSRPCSHQPLPTRSSVA